MVKRGSCNFINKTVNVQASGASAALVIPRAMHASEHAAT